MCGTVCIGCCRACAEKGGSGGSGCAIFKSLIRLLPFDIVPDIVDNSSTVTNRLLITEEATMTKTKAPKAPKAMIINVIKSGGAKSVETGINLLLIKPVAPAEISSASGVYTNLCYNIMAGSVDPSIMAAHAVRGQLKKLLVMSQADMNACKQLLSLDPAAIRAAWTIYFNGAKKVIGVTLQGLAKACAEKKEKSETLKEKLLAWIATVPPATLDALPVRLHDILIDIMPEEKV